jgi:nitrate/TMAO reductase-like tetraheme cytochrome c subunit
MGFLQNIFTAVRDWFARLSTGWAIVILALITAGAIGGGLYTYQVYDYVQHDNEFCLSCHLMANPAEQFGSSAHRGLGCKACHQPTLVERSMMGLTAIVENPDSISVHAHVPNDRCVSCHVDGNPSEWILIQQSAGHLVHFTSEEDALAGLECVECHSTSIHQFTATDQTCALAGCHDDIEIRLGAMASHEIPCGACHGFSDILTEADEAAGVTAQDLLAPNAGTCLSCHAMRTLVEFPEHDPHEGVCSSCHNPHTQSEVIEAANSCTDAGCHTDPAAESPFHQGLPPGVAEGCVECHAAHDFSAAGRTCLDCHGDIFDDVPRRGSVTGDHPDFSAGPVAPADEPEEVTGAILPGLTGLTGVIHPTLQAAPLVAALVQVAGADSVEFSHGQHRDVDCSSCHTSEGGHGTLLITGLTDCRSCHHSEPGPVAGGCGACHGGQAGPVGGIQVARDLSLTVGPGTRSAEIEFDHEVHASQDCGECHTGGLSMTADRVDCNSCHEDHHEAGSSCKTCHVSAPESAHPLETVHLGCSGVGCHETLPFGGGVPDNREFCLTCHQGQADHQIQEPSCTECHRLPPPGEHAFVAAGGDR